MMSQPGGGQIFVGVLMLLVGLGFGLAALADFYLLVKVTLNTLWHQVKTSIERGSLMSSDNSNLLLWECITYRQPPEKLAKLSCTEKYLFTSTMAISKPV
jgi:hypothetical protein